MNPDKPLIIESNRRILLDTSVAHFEEIRNEISSFLNLIKSPKKFYTYELSMISLWNGFSSGMDGQDIQDVLEKYSKFEVPVGIIKFIRENYEKFGIVELSDFNKQKIEVKINHSEIAKNLLSNPEVNTYLEEESGSNRMLLDQSNKSIFKSVLSKLRYPVRDYCQYDDGDSIEVDYNKNFIPHPYQVQAINSFMDDSKLVKGGSGVIVMPCGSGKTIVGLMAITKLKMSTLVITPNIISLRQWKKEILKNTSLEEDDIGEYSGHNKDFNKITLTTYQILTYRKDNNSEFQHLSLFTDHNWGLIIYDETHMLPANIFRYVTAIQSKRRMGLTATLVREDGKETDVFTLIGPKKFDLPWKELEEKQHIATVKCVEIKVRMDHGTETDYFTTLSEIKQYRIAAENPEKLVIIKQLLKKFPKRQIIIIGQYIRQLEHISEILKIPILTGKTPNQEREKIYKEFNNREIDTLVVSKIANFAVDLPNAEIAIQISGSFGSRQEEAQRLGRIIRPKEVDPANNKYNQAWFFTLATQYTKEELFAQNRKNFLIAQGYQYEMLDSNRFESEFETKF